MAYNFPPFAGIAGYRWSKLTRHLADLGHTVHVLTVQWDTIGGDSFLEDVSHADIVIHRIPSGVPHNWIVRRFQHRWQERVRNVSIRPLRYLSCWDDFAQRWGRHAVPAARRIMREHGIRILVATGAPFQTLRWAAEVRRLEPDIRYLADFRDPWDAKAGSLPAARVEQIRRWRADTVATADTVTAISATLLDWTKEYGAVQDGAVITNGYDSKGLQGLRYDPHASHPYMFGYAGAFYNRRIEPFAVFLEYLRHRISLGLPARTVLIGRIHNEPRDMIRDFPDGTFEILPPMHQREALAKLLQARYALQVNAPHTSYAHSTKVFEYGAMGMPVLSFNYGAEIATLLAQTKMGFSVDCTDAAALDFAALDQIVDAPAHPELTFELAAFDHKAIARQWSELIQRHASAL